MFKRSFTTFGHLLKHVRYINTSPAKTSPIRTGFKIAFGKYLFVTNTVTSGLLMGIGDIIQQEIEYQNKQLPERYDWKRLERMFYIGIVMGPLHHVFYKYLDLYLPKRTINSVGKKIFYDQILMSPACILTFFYGMGLLERKSLKECTEEVKEKAVHVYLVSFIWPPAQAINFYYVPVKYQVSYVNLITMFFNVFLSFMKHRELAEENAKLVKSKSEIL